MKKQRVFWWIFHVTGAQGRWLQLLAPLLCPGRDHCKASASSCLASFKVLRWLAFWNVTVGTFWILPMSRFPASSFAPLTLVVLTLPVSHLEQILKHSPSSCPPITIARVPVPGLVTAKWHNSGPASASVALLAGADLPSWALCILAYSLTSTPYRGQTGSGYGICEYCREHTSEIQPSDSGLFIINHEKWYLDFLPIWNGSP